MTNVKDLLNREKTLFTSTVSGDINGEVSLLGESLDTFVEKRSFANIVMSLWLGRKLKSIKTEQFAEMVLKLLVDHGPYVSGAVNTMIAARAGKDLVSSLAAGLLTVGNRFGGAINGAAGVLFAGVAGKQSAADIVVAFAQKKEYIPGIGHRKYRLDMPDKRAKQIQEFGRQLSSHLHLDLALEVEKITTNKKPNLILNVDGSIAAVLLDLLTVEEKLNSSEIKPLVDSEFFNALFILSRSVGFMAHYFDQKRLNEPLFRLSEDQVLVTKGI